MIYIPEAVELSAPLSSFFLFSSAASGFTDFLSPDSEVVVSFSSSEIKLILLKI